MTAAPRAALRACIALAAILCGQDDDKTAAGPKGGSEQERTKAKLQDRLSRYFVKRKETEDASIASPSSVRVEGSVQDETGIAALEALQAIHHQYARVQDETEQASSGKGEPPILGSRDTNTIRLLISIVCNWHLLALVREFDRQYAATGAAKGRFPDISASSSRFAEIASEEEQIARTRRAKAQLDIVSERLAHALDLFSDIIFGCRHTDPQNDAFADIAMSVSVSHLLCIGLRVGWLPLPDSHSQKRKEKGAAIVARILRSLPTAESLRSLSGASQLLSTSSLDGNSSKVPKYVKAMTERLYSAQLLRPNGVSALLRVSFAGDEANERGLMKKLTSVGQLMSTPPAGMSTDVFVRATMPRLLEIVGELPRQRQSDNAPSLFSTPAQKDAACYALARQNEVDANLMRSLEQEHIFNFIVPNVDEISDDIEDGRIRGQQLTTALSLLHEIAEHVEPSSSHLVSLLSPIACTLFAIISATGKASDKPLVSAFDAKDKARQAQASIANELAKSLFKTWLRLSDAEDCMSVLSPHGKNSIFRLHQLGENALSTGVREKDKVAALQVRNGVIYIEKRRKSSSINLQEQLQKLSMSELSGQDLRTGDAGEDSTSTALLAAFSVAPSPQLLSDFLKATERRDLASRLLVELLDSYQQDELRSKASDHPMLGAMFLQHIMQLCQSFGTDLLLGQPDKILAFVEFALNANSQAISAGEETKKDDPKVEKESRTRSAALPDLFNINGSSEQGIEAVNGADNDEEEPNDENDEVKETALNLLLSLLESDESITPHTHSILIVIQSHVEKATTSKSEAIRASAREASLVLTARSLSTQKAPRDSQDESLLYDEERALRRGREMYQEALKLLQDPILPVRAHGIITLKDLISAASQKTSGKTPVMLDQALVPAILDIFLKAVCDDESFLYLNAVKGLSEMGSMGSREVVKRLVSLYVGDGNTQSLTQAEVDKRLRVGEALLQVVQRLEEAISSYANDIVGPVLTAVRLSSLPTTLRSSMLSILGTCIEASPAAMVSQGHARTIASAMLDLLSVEMDRTAKTTQSQIDDALETSTKLPQLRRAALLLLILLVRGTTHQLEESREADSSSHWPNETPRLERLRMPGGGTLGVPSGASSLIMDSGAPSSAQLLFPPALIRRLLTITTFVGQHDGDSLVRHQAMELLQDVDNLKLEALHSGVAIDN